MSDKQHKINEKEDLIFLAQWEKEKKEALKNPQPSQPGEIIICKIRKLHL